MEAGDDAEISSAPAAMGPEELAQCRLGAFPPGMDRPWPTVGIDHHHVDSGEKVDGQAVAAAVESIRVAPGT